MNKTASSNSLFPIILGDFNARSSSWWKEDKTTTEDIHLEALTSLHNSDKLISEPTQSLCKVLSVHQSGFWSNDSCGSLLSIVYNLYKAFDAYTTLETCYVFLDISKAFDKVWHQGLVFKLMSVGVSDSLLSLIESFLNN